MLVAAFLRPAPDSGPAGAGAPHSLPALQPRPGCGVPLAPGSGGPATLLACRGHGSSQHGLGMVKCRDEKHRQWGAPGARGWEEASEKTWIVASLPIWLLPSPPVMPTGEWHPLSEGASQSGPSLVHRRPVKGFVRQPNA